MPPIRDENGDGQVEMNRDEELDALSVATANYLKVTGFPMEGKRLVWVNDSRAYYPSKEFRDLPHELFEATPYASVYKYSHNVLPARSALGAGGCKDCHSSKSLFFQRPVLDLSFGKDGKSQWSPNNRILKIPEEIGTRPVQE
jgi:hypothetical protein